MFINGKSLLKLAPIKDMFDCKIRHHGVSHGLSEAGYDIRIKQRVEFINDSYGNRVNIREPGDPEGNTFFGSFTIASSIEEFQTPNFLVGTVKDKSTWARRGLSVFNTVIEPGWNGFLTLELVYHGFGSLVIEAGSGIAQVLYGALSEDSCYGDGKYQNAADRPQTALLS